MHARNQVIDQRCKKSKKEKSIRNKARENETWENVGIKISDIEEKVQKTKREKQKTADPFQKQTKTNSFFYKTFVVSRRLFTLSLSKHSFVPGRKELKKEYQTASQK